MTLVMISQAFPVLEQLRAQEEARERGRKEGSEEQAPVPTLAEITWPDCGLGDHQVGVASEDCLPRAARQGGRFKARREGAGPMSPTPPCIFCEIVKGDVPSYKVRETGRALAFLDIHPISWGHTLVVPKAHAADLPEVTPEDWKEVAELARWVALRLRKVLEVEGNNLIVASGKAAEQSVSHLHIHVIPRREGDEVGLQDWWVSKIQPTDPEELSRTATVLREKA